MKEIKRQADYGIDTKMDAQSLRKVLINISNLATAEINEQESKIKGGKLL